MNRHRPLWLSADSSARSRLTYAIVVVGYALVVAGGAKVVTELAGSMMTTVAFAGTWLILALGVAYAAVRLRPALGGALLLGTGIAAILVLLFGGMQMLG